MNFNYYVILPNPSSGNWCEQLYTINTMREWLNSRNIQFYEMILNHEQIPHTFLMDTQDAIAFKLRFGL